MGYKHSVVLNRRYTDMYREIEFVLRSLLYEVVSKDVSSKQRSEIGPRYID